MVYPMPKPGASRQTPPNLPISARWPWVVPQGDGEWHQAGFVFDAGLLTFYFDGEQLGESRQLRNLGAIASQNYDWHLIEDATAISAPSEYLDLGDYDEAALWYRALAAEEMRSLYRDGFAGLSSSAVPEPSTVVLLAAGAAVLLLFTRHFRHSLQS